MSSAARYSAARPRGGSDRVQRVWAW